MTKNILLAATCASVLAFAGACSPAAVASLPTTGAAVSTQNTTMDERAMIALELSYRTAGQAYLTARDRNLLPADTLASARAALTQAYDALRLARAAYDAGDAVGWAQRASIVTSALGEAKRLLPQ